MRQSEITEDGMESATRDFETVGVCLLSKILSEAQLQPLRAAVDACVTKRAGKRVFKPPSSDNGPDLLLLLTDLASHLSRRPVRMVRILAFDKTPELNWRVPWH